jgi:hypothetical protein
VIPNVTKGDDMRGLLRYLAGPGRGNEHVDPHIVAGDRHLTAWHGAEILDEASAHEIAGYLDKPRRVYGTEVLAQVTEADPDTGERRVIGHKPQHVWHCSLSIRADEGVLGDERWQVIAEDFAAAMGLVEDGRAPCRWVAIHHGPSKAGNDHVHVVASMVREDGTKWSPWRDFPKAQAACRELERKYGLERVDGRGRGVGERGEKPSERARAERVGAGARPAPVELAERLRRAAVAAEGEAEWIRRCHADDVVLKPYFAKGTTDVVRGYKAALKPREYPRADPSEPPKREPWVFYAGGKLGRDLSLPRLRESWPEPTVEQAQHAADEWQAAFRGRPVVHPGRETKTPPAERSRVAAVRLAALNDRLASIPVHDRRAWAEVARDTSAALSAWARFDPGLAPHMQAAARVVARSAWLEGRTGEPASRARRPQASAMGTAMILLAARRDDKPLVAGLVLAQQLARTIGALRDYHREVGNLREAERLQVGALEELRRLDLAGYSRAPVIELLPEEQRAAAQALELTRLRPGEEQPVKGHGDPLPAKLDTRDRESSRGGDGYGR